MREKIKSTENKAKDIETSNKLQELWADFGELAAEQDILSARVQQIVGQRRQIYSEIMKLKESMQNEKGKPEKTTD